MPSPMPGPDSPLHILTYAKSLHDGGVERAQSRLIGGWAAAGARVTLVLGAGGGPHDGEIPPGVEVIAGGAPYRRLVAALPAAVRDARPDIVFCPGNFYTFAALWLRVRLGRACPPIVAKVSNRLDRRDQPWWLAVAYRVWLRAHALFVDRFVAMTPAMAEETVAAMGVAPDRVSEIANPPAIAWEGPETPEMARPYLIGIGRLVAQKRWDRAIAALARTTRRDVGLMILGDGDARPALERQVAALELGDRVRLCGYATNPMPGLAGASALVLTSDFEGVPGVLQEALAVGTPVVTTESSVAIREIVTDPALGSIVPMDDTDALAAAFDHWLSPDTPRPAPVAPRGSDSIDCYLRLFRALRRG